MTRMQVGDATRGSNHTTAHSPMVERIFLKTNGRERTPKTKKEGSLASAQNPSRFLRSFGAIPGGLCPGNERCPGHVPTRETKRRHQQKNSSYKINNRPEGDRFAHIVDLFLVPSVLGDIPHG